MRLLGAAGPSGMGGLGLMRAPQAGRLQPAPVAVAARGGQRAAGGARLVGGGGPIFNSAVKELALGSGQAGSLVQAAFTSAEVGGAAADRCPHPPRHPASAAGDVLKWLVDDGLLQREEVPGTPGLKYVYSLPDTDAGVIRARLLDLQGFESFVEELALGSGQPGSLVQAAFTSAEVAAAAAARCTHLPQQPASAASKALRRMADDGLLQREEVPGTPGPQYVYSLPDTDAGVIRARLLDLQSFASVVEELALGSGQAGSLVQAAFTPAEVGDAAADRCPHLQPAEGASKVLRRMADDGLLQREEVPGTPGPQYVYSLPDTDAGVIRARISDLAPEQGGVQALTAADTRDRRVLGEEEGCLCAVDIYCGLQDLSITAFFMTHCHTDHLLGFNTQQNLVQYDAGTGPLVYGPPGSARAVAVYRLRHAPEGLEAGAALGHREQEYGKPFHIPAPAGSAHPGVKAVLLPAGHTRASAIVVAVDLSSGAAFLHTGDTRATTQVLVGLEWGCRDLFAHVSSVYGIRAWFKQVVVDANAERRPRTGPVPPCLSSEQWAERIAGVMTEALGMGFRQKMDVYFFVTAYCDSRVQELFLEISRSRFREPVMITISDCAYRLLEGDGEDMSQFTTAPGGQITILPPSDPRVGAFDGRAERLRAYMDEAAAPQGRGPAIGTFLQVAGWGRDRDPRTGPQLRSMAVDRMFTASFGYSEHSSAAELGALMAVLGRLAPGAVFRALDSHHCPAVPGQAAAAAAAAQQQQQQQQQPAAPMSDVEVAQGAAAAALLDLDLGSQLGLSGDLAAAEPMEVDFVAGLLA